MDLMFFLSVSRFMKLPRKPSQRTKIHFRLSKRV